MDVGLILDVQVFRYREKVGGGCRVWQFTQDSAYAETNTVSLFGQLQPGLIYPFTVKMLLV